MMLYHLTQYHLNPSDYDISLQTQIVTYIYVTFIIISTYIHFHSNKIDFTVASITLLHEAASDIILLHTIIVQILRDVRI